MKYVFLLLSFCSVFTLLSAQYESDYSNALALYLDGKREVKVTSGKVDILTATHAIEVERAPKWKQSIGQALWYGLQTNKKPGIILLIEHPDQRKYAIQLGSALQYAGLDNSIQVWLYPDDFPGLEVESTESRVQRAAATGKQYWLNTSSNKRHTARCRYFENTSKGRYCSAKEGEPAGCCN